MSPFGALLSSRFVPLSSVLRSGSLPDAVAASLAMPIACMPVSVDGARFISMGRRDRTGKYTRFRRRPDQRALVHCVEDAHGWLRNGERDVGTWVKVSFTFKQCHSGTLHQYYSSHELSARYFFGWVKLLTKARTRYLAPKARR